MGLGAGEDTHFSSLKASDPGGLICELSPRDKARAGGPVHLEHKRGQGLIP